MSNPIYIAFITTFSLLIGLTSCKDKSKVYRPTTTIIEGQITSSDEPVITLTGDKELKAAMDPAGKFILQGELEKAGIYTIKLGYHILPVFIVPGDRISFTADIRNLAGNTQFKGDHANENNYLVAYENLKSDSEPKDFEMFFTQNEESFLKAVEERTMTFNENQQAYQKKNGPFDEFFAEMISEEVNYDAAIMKMNYPNYFNYLRPDSNLVLSDTYESFLQNLEVDTEDNLMVPSYTEFIVMYLEFKTKAENKDTAAPLTVRKFNNIEKYFQTPRIKDLLYYRVAKDAIENTVNDAAQIMNQFQQVQTNETYKNEINLLFEAWAHLLKDNKAPDFQYENIFGTKTSLSDLKDKIVYIDVWATWCGPCLHELPYLEKLQEQYRNDRELAFVSISIDEDVNAWQQMVRKKNMKGLQLIADQNWNSSIINDYKISGIPRFLIIGKNGLILNANAPRPSSKELISELEAALKK